ncbi:MAG: tRNA glutamyl-Q(34) synthetase GluQRS [Maritimibacter sp.]
MLTRFAPSPTGALHLGHAFSALTVWHQAEHLGATALLRIEDFDSERCKSGYVDDILEDLTWLGLSWPAPPRRSSEHFAEYDETLKVLEARGLLYPCGCSRRVIKAAGAKPGWDGYVYPGTCRHRAMETRAPKDAIRLNLQAALAQIETPLTFVETGPLFGGAYSFVPNDMKQHKLLERMGDPILKRATGDPAYHLACPHDDAFQGMTHVVRGADLWRATWLHVVLQNLMGWSTPTYHHHDLITDDQGKRLAKIDASKALRSFRQEGATPADIRALVGF